ncbi:glycine cleavage system aminomethyltransferase GcvT [Acetonema longum]|uniref:Aminomethyltransferase n=1 Tax=Acetonema longum DSM 6540 TaxID=1009370 RepID=F7NPH5_9FIRM|nr:glycine cleavage system aminomethyltransferase GcvT [Acetonema longum]EGO62055.1 glycine cleavage system aminomethyltransferase T [Acetonema longum DSM 6540]
MTQKTPLYDIHVQYGGKIIEFGGWMLPVQYSGIIAEHRAVREKAGLFDVSHMGEVKVNGPDALAYLQKAVTNDVARLADYQVQYTPMCYPDGGTVDDLLIYRCGAQEYLLVINAANIAKDYDWLKRNTAGFNVTVDNVSSQTAQLALQGPLAQTILSQITQAPLDKIGYYWFMRSVQVAGRQVMLSRTGYTGEDGFEIYCRNEDAAPLWEAIMTAGKNQGLLPAGLGCRDTLRLEACLPLYGHELSPQISPLEAGLGYFVKLDKGDFNGREVLLRQKEQGLTRKLAGFVLTDRGVARSEYPVIAAGRQAGQVTSGSYSPTLDKNLGLALVETEFAGQGQKLEIEIRGKNAAAEVIARPFYKRKG